MCADDGGENREVKGHATDQDVIFGKDAREAIMYCLWGL